MAGTSDKQKCLERWYLEAFLVRLGIKPSAIDAGQEPPDFIIVMPEGRIAVEITEFHSSEKGPSGHPRRLIEEEWGRLQRSIQAERGKHPQLDAINCNLIFKSLTLPSTAEYPQFVEQLLTFCTAFLPQVTEKENRFQFSGEGYPLLMKYLKEIYLQSVGYYITWEWNHAAAFVGIDEEELKTAIRKKIGVARPPKVKKNWLLIVSGYRLSQAIGLVDVETLNEYVDFNRSLEDSEYDKVFIFQYMLDRILAWERAIGWLEMKEARFVGTDEARGNDPYSR